MCEIGLGDGRPPQMGVRTEGGSPTATGALNRPLVGECVPTGPAQPEAGPELLRGPLAQAPLSGEMLARTSTGTPHHSGAGSLALRGCATLCRDGDDMDFVLGQPYFVNLKQG